MIHQPITDGSQVLAHDGFDVQAHAEAVTSIPNLALQAHLPEEKLVTADAFSRDLFWSFYKYAPRLEPNEPLTAAHQINKQLLTEILSTREWQDLKAAGTVSDQLTSAMATIGVSKRALAALDAETVERINNLHDLETEARRFFEQAESLEELASDATPDRASSMFGLAKRWRSKGEEKASKAQAAAQYVAASGEKRADAVRRAARKAAKEATQEVEAFTAAMQTFGGGGGFSLDGADGAGGAETGVSVKEKLAIAQRVGQSDRLKQIAEICGRFTRIALQVQKEKVQTEASEITSITRGADLARLLPVETALLSDPDLELLFYSKLTESALMQYELTGNEPKGKGPIIFAVDSSGSMSSRLGNMTAEVWSKSVMLAILAIARKQKRDAVVMHFSSRSQLRTFRFTEGQASYNQLIECADHFYGGGTYFEGWMRQAATIIKDAKFDKADIICISDGLASISDAFVKRWQQIRETNGTRCLSVLIGTDQGIESLEKISDGVMTINDLSKDTAVLKELFSI